ncbi:uncharacterized protein LOC111942221 isoform X2 [Cyanistes caeruleus]|uniref:uncharacterized protein LOC111942221 isoform X2 n=1 Tax=Cyanistes caeruleus TaxID=156563 RepID=UPI000CDB9716|nr:uncharacterized protein LOC111942221 isoform X2 [Cyanistes caeruleus]
MDIQVLWKAAFPAGSSHSSAASAAGRNGMAHMSTGPDTGDLVAGKAPPLALRYEDLKPSGPPAGVSADRISPAPGLDAAQKPDSHHRVPPTEKTKYTSEKKSQERFEVMWKMLKEFKQGAQEVDEEAVLKAVFPGGNSGSLAASAAGREAMPGTVPGDWDRDMDYVEALVENGLKFLEDIGAKPLGEGDAASQPIPRTEPQGGGEVTGVSAGSTSPDLEVVTAPKPGSHRRGPPKRKTQDNGTKKSVLSNDFLRPTKKEVQGGQAGTTTHAQNIWESMRRIFSLGTHGLIKLMAILVAGALFLMMCCAGIWYCWNRKGSMSAPSEDQPKTPLSEKLTCHPWSLNLSPSAVLQPHFEGVPKPIPSKAKPYAPDPPGSAP